MHCIFCHDILEENVLYQTEHFKLVFDIDPIQTGHLLLISRKHFTSLSELPPAALHDLIETEQKLVTLLEKELPISGVTLVSNDKDLMDDGTHFHVHLIPRVKNDGFWDTIEIEQLPFSLTNFLEIIKK